jgi:hypothetical protein
MSDPIQQFNRDPDPDEPKRRSPMLAHWPPETPQPKRHERDIEDEKSSLKVSRNESAHETRGEEAFIETARILLQRVGRLSDDEGEER